MTNDTVRTWIDIDRSALEHNVGQFLHLIPKHTRMMAVIKSNAYGHGLTLIAQLLRHHKHMWFGVDSIVEALRLREEGITNPILVLGATLPTRLQEAATHGITITISNFETLTALKKLGTRPTFHLKIDTGMHRQGFQSNEIPKLITTLKKYNLQPEGIYTHFAAAKDILYPTFTRTQIEEFKKITAQIEQAGFKNLIRHAAASGGAILFPESHFDMVRIGMGIYGYWPSLESKLIHPHHISLEPILSWHTVVSEVKTIPKDSYIGYDLTEHATRTTKIAILPIGYWHGYDRGFSGIGEVLIRGMRARVLGRVSMDMIIVDVTHIPKITVGDHVVLIGTQGKETLRADDLGLKIGTSSYELLTRINPLIQHNAI